MKEKQGTVANTYNLSYLWRQRLRGSQFETSLDKKLRPPPISSNKSWVGGKCHPLIKKKNTVQAGLGRKHETLFKKLLKQKGLAGSVG
jgi:hypothetical protein